MGNKRIIFVPGKNPKPRDEEHHLALWRCLLRGVEQADPETRNEIEADPDCFSLASWNYTYYRRHKSLERDLPWIEHLLTRTGATEEEKQKIHSFRTYVGRAIYTLADIFPALINVAPDPAVKGAVKETQRYFQNQGNVGLKIREILKRLIRDAWSKEQRILLIGHSMGAIISYDSLWELGREEGYKGKVDLFLTLGSPLGMRFVQHRLVGIREARSRRYPDNIRRWLNISSRGDLTALDPYVGDDFEDMVNDGLTESIRDEHRDIYNYFVGTKGLNVHRSYGYLVNQKVGAAIADWWKEG